MAKVNDIYEFLCELAPLELQMDFDNSGIQIGRLSSEVCKVILSLDITDEVVDEAIENDAELIVSHHPILFNSFKQITNSDPAKERILKLIENRISVISMHTNLDIAEGGVNDVLIGLLGAAPVKALDSSGCGRIGELDTPVSIETFVKRCKKALNNKRIKYFSAGRKVSMLAVMGGAGGDFIEDAYKMGCDTYVTSDIKYHQLLRAQELGLNLIDADHFCTENPVMPVLRDKLAARFPEVEFQVSERHGQIIEYI